MTAPVPNAVWSLETRHLGKRVQIYDCLESTNTLALSLADPAQHGMVLLAREQTAGRGQFGRSWLAPPGSSVLMTVLLCAPAKLLRPALLTVWAAVSVCQSILKLVNTQAKIKWPNDVYLHGKKVCGILIEQRSTGRTDHPYATAVGIGLNLTQSQEHFDEAQLPLAGSLLSLTGIRLSWEEAARELIRQLDAQYDLLLHDDGQTLETLWKQRLGLLGKHVVATGTTFTQRGRLLDVTLLGVAIETETGEIVQMPPETIRQLSEAQ
jgi:BirA family transcriptional regulator, biotin operon repressor / biotin---[acetyl-CoA-carboxylase] ligase